MNTNEQNLTDMVKDKQLDVEAAKRLTAPLLKKGWMLVFGGWALGLIPVIGMLGWAIAFIGGIAVGIVAMTRGNSSGGLILLLTAWFGTAIVAIVELFLWVALGFGGTAMLSGL